MTRTPLSDIRTAIADAITALPTYSAPPGDVAHIPCVVVGPPSLRRTQSLGGLWELTYPVVIVGRSYDMTEVHTEVDDALWSVISDLEHAGPTLPGYLRTDSSDPGTAEIAGHQQPTHTLNVIAQTMYCLE